MVDASAWLGVEIDCGYVAAAAWLWRGDVVIVVIASSGHEVAIESLTASRGRGGGPEFDRKLNIRAL
jgi:hypothetical protein